MCTQVNSNNNGYCYFRKRYRPCEAYRRFSTHIGLEHNIMRNSEHHAPIQTYLHLVGVKILQITH